MSAHNSKRNHGRLVEICSDQITALQSDLDEVAQRSRTPMEAFFPDGHVFEYFLQRLRLVASQSCRVLRVHDIRDVPDSIDDFPCVEVVLRIVGLKLNNPVTGKQMLSPDWLRDHFVGQQSRQAFLDSFSRFLRDSIPADHPEADLKRKFEHYRDGTPGDLPARADLHVWRDELVRHLVAAKKWLRNLQRPNREFTKENRTDFLKETSHPMFWWSKYVQEGRIILKQIARHSPRATAMELLALKFDKSVESIKSRFRGEV